MYRYMGLGMFFSLYASLGVNAHYRLAGGVRDFLLVRLKTFIYARFHA